MSDEVFKWTSVWGKEREFKNLDEARDRLKRVEVKYAEMLHVWHETDFFTPGSTSAIDFEIRMEGWCAEGAALEDQIEKWEKEKKA